MSGPRVLCIGDIVSGSFVTLSEDYATVTTDDKGYKRLSFELGAKLPYKGLQEVKAVECAPNAAVSMSRLGLDVSLMAWLSDDKIGQEMASYLKDQGVGTDDLAVEAGKRSNYHLYLRYGADRTKLQKFEDYSYEWHEPATKPDWVYLGVLGEKTWPLHEAILAYLDANPDIKLAFQPGMYHLMWGTQKMAAFYKRAAVVVLNREEAVQVTGKNHDDMAGLIQGLHELGVKFAVITDGPEGAYASNGQQTLFMPIYPDPKAPYDRTGAGDAFASTLTAALALGESMEVALAWAPVNSMSVSQYLGAQEGLLRKEQLEEYLKNAPQSYRSEPFLS